MRPFGVWSIPSIIAPGRASSWNSAPGFEITTGSSGVLRFTPGGAAPNSAEREAAKNVAMKARTDFMV